MAPVAPVNRRQLKWTVPAMITLALPFGAFVCMGLWWQTAFSWDADFRPPWYCALFLIGALAMAVATPVSLIWTIILFCRRKPQTNERA